MRQKLKAALTGYLGFRQFVRTAFGLLLFGSGRMDTFDGYVHSTKPFYTYSIILAYFSPIVNISHLGIFVYSLLTHLNYSLYSILVSFNMNESSVISNSLYSFSLYVASWTARLASSILPGSNRLVSNRLVPFIYN